MMTHKCSNQEKQTNFYSVKASGFQSFDKHIYTQRIVYISVINLTMNTLSQLFQQWIIDLGVVQLKCRSKTQRFLFDNKNNIFQ